jgi:hypothetical protein
MNTASSKPVALLVVVASLVAAGLWWSATRDGETEPADDAAANPSGPESVVALPEEKPLPAGVERMGDGSDGEKSRRSLQRLRQELLAKNTGEAVDWIREALESGADRDTGLRFAIGADGTLEEWPTFRTFLLDVLLEVDPAAAAGLSRRILETPTSADEWALALRNLARGGDLATDRTFIVGKTEELISNPSWQAEPSVGYLNAFDVLVHLKATESTPLMSDLVQRKDRKDLAHAAFLTLDRLVQLAPRDMLGRIAEDPNLRESRPEMVAQQFARADVRDPEQRSLVENWLLDPQRTEAELYAFTSVYPNQNLFVSRNLLTKESSHSGTDLAAHDREALRIITGWAENPAFEPISGHVADLERRVHGFVAARNQSQTVISPSPLHASD